MIVGTTLWSVLFALEGLGLAAVVGEWAKASGAEKATLFLVASSLSHVFTGMFSMTIIAYWLALTFVGIGMALGTAYPKWLGWVLIVLGLATVAAVGFPQALTVQSQTLQFLFAALSILSTLWVLVIGIWITCKAW